MTTSQATLAASAGLMTAGLMTAALLFSGCSREDIYGGQTFTQTVAQAYADCNESEIRFLAGKEGIQTAFANCGSNHFANISWSPSGRYLYFQLTHGGHVMDGEDKTIITVPTEMPIANAAWLGDDLLAVPLGPAQDATSPTDRIILFNRSAKTLNEINVPLQEIRDLQAGADDSHLILTGLDDQGLRKAVIADTRTGDLSPALPWLDQLDAAHGRLVVSQKAGLVGLADAQGGTLLRLDGTELATLPGAHRVIPHPEGRYVAIELDGAPVSPFDMRSWDELSETARKRELARQEKWLANQPDWLTKEITPPEIQIIDLKKGARYRVTAFWGDHFQWYEARNYYVSFVLFGIEGKQLNANVGLTNLHERLRMLDKGETPL
ncbi:MAG: hypothetical protein GXP62_11500, partial [Oligoflexia bacterium]|nr:hypothetical protein [Oligoflexia bacterium]